MLEDKFPFKVLLFLKENDKYSECFLDICNQYFNDVAYTAADSISEAEVCLGEWSGDYLFSFRSKIILPSKWLKKAKFKAINFHPGPPEYRGIGCINFAFLDMVESYGVTAHIMNETVDSGAIVDVKRFAISQDASIKSVLKKSYHEVFIQAEEIFEAICSEGERGLERMISSYVDVLWSKSLYTKNKLEDLYCIGTNSDFLKDANSLNNYLRATLYDDFVPYIQFFDKKFIFRGDV